MADYNEMLNILENQEKLLQFSEFTNETALKVGMLAIEMAQEMGKNIAIDIIRNGHQIFHYSFQGTSIDNDQWILRKSRVASRFGRSSMYVGTYLKSIGKTIEEKYFVSPLEYSAFGGSFPIYVKNIGSIGTITVSGLTQEEDHEMVVMVLKKYLKA